MDLSVFTPLLRSLIASAASALLAKNLLTADQAATFTNLVYNAVLGLVALISWGWTAWKSTAAQRIKTVNELPQVDKVIVNDPAVKEVATSPTVVLNTATLKASMLATVLALFVMGGLLAGCKTSGTSAGASIGGAIVTADAKLRDKCAYLQDGVRIAQLGVAILYPGASTIVADGAALIDANCTGAPITDAATALDRMQKVIEAVRPIATATGQN